jgi:anti-sigma regulatory factor (Ser/Thr protein kinase)
MMEDYDQVLRLEVPCDPKAPGAVRAALNRFARASWDLDDIILVASELTTNAVLHSGCDETHKLEFQAAIGPGSVVVSVRDPGLSEQSVSPRGSGGGWGLRIVHRLADRWGTERDDGYRVWAELALPG